MIWPFRKTSNRNAVIRQPATISRYWNAAKTDRLTGNWITEEISINKSLEYRLKTLRARAQDMERNHPIVRRWIALLDQNVIGASGFRFQPQIPNDRDKPRYDQAANDTVERHWKRFARNIEITGRFNLDALCRLIMRRVAIDGEIFFLKIARPDLEYGFTLQPIEASSLDYSLNRESENIIMGTQVDEFGKPLNYYFRKGKRRSSPEHDIIPADRIIHICRHDFAEQQRGYPWAACVMEPLEKLAKYQEAEIVAAVTASAKMGFFTKTSPELIGEGKTSNETFSLDATSGTIEGIPPGWGFQAWDPQHPTSAYPAFIEAKLQEVSSGLNISYFTLANDLTKVNYTSSRTGLLEDRQYFELLQNWIIDQFLTPVFETWLTIALSLGRITTLTGSALPATKREKFSQCRFQGRRWQWVDPQREVNAAILAMQNNLKSPIRIMSEMGIDAWDEYSDLSLAKEWRDELGLKEAGQPNEQTTEETDDETE